MNGDLHSEWARLVFECFASAGVRDVVLSPGSRSTPLALAAAGHSELRVTPIVDERSAAFFALGQARITGRPSLLLCTSGSAAAHYFPAVVEAERAGLPLIALTADRPWQLTRASANQTFDQHGLYGDHVRDFFELGAPAVEALDHVPRIVAQAVLAATSPLPGPVQVNARFDKPLEPVASHGDEPWRSRLRALAARGAPRVFLPSSAASPGGAARVADLFLASRRTLIVAGPARGREPASVAARRLRRALSRLGADGTTLLLAEATSGALYGKELDGLVFAGFDTWLGAACTDAGPPDLVIEIGGPPTSSAWPALLAGWRGVPRVIASEGPIADPVGTATDIVIGDSASLLERVALVSTERDADRAWRDRMAEWATVAHDCASRFAMSHGQSPEAPLSEPAIYRTLVQQLPDGSVLAVGNSLPARDLDAFGGRTSREICVLHQRGLSGIDGGIAGTLGARSVTPDQHPVVALLGDVSTLHDIGSLASVGTASGPLVLLVVNNGGGQIFHQLPVAQAVSAEALERWFVQPPRVSFEHAARAFSLGYARVEREGELIPALTRALSVKGVTLLEAVVAADDGHCARRDLVELARRSMRPKAAGA